MKKCTITILITLCFTSAFAQEEIIQPTVIKLDLGGKKLVYDKAKLNNLQKGDFYQIEITDASSSLYKYSIGNKDSSTSSSLNFPTFATLPIDGLTAAVAGLSSLGGLLGSISKSERDVVELTRYYLSMMDLTENDEKVLKANIATKIPKDTRAQVTPILYAAKENIRSFLTDIEEEKRIVDNILMDIYKAVLADQVKENSANPFGKIQDPGSLIGEIFQTRNRLDEKSQNIAAEYKNYRTILGNNEFESAISKDDQLKALDAQIRKAYDEFEPAIQKLMGPISGDNFFKLASLLIPSINKTTVFKSLPIQLTEEQTVLEIKATPRSDGFGLPEYHTKIKFPINDKSFWGLSSGLYVSFPADDAYSVRTTFSKTDTTFSLVNENPEKLEVGFNTLIRRGWKIGSNQSTFWHVGFGPGLTVTNKVKPRFLLGTGLAFGNKHAFLIDFGLITGYYDVLSNAFEANNLENIPIAPTDYMKSKLKAGGYFSIGYLFLK